MSLKIEKKFKDTYLFTLENRNGSQVKISNYGAIITSYRVKTINGDFNDIVLGFDNLEDYRAPAFLAQYPWFGCAVGRNANRVKNAEFILDGKKIELTKNNGNHQLHGGIEGFDKKTWKPLEESFTDNSITLFYQSPDGEEGYPGTLDVHLKYSFNNQDDLTYEFTATTDKPTPVNLTHHSYFNLNNGTGLIHDHELKIPASYYLEQQEIVATGNLVSVANSPFDFRNFKKIGDGLEQIPEYDHSFALDDPNGIYPAAELYSAASGLKLSIYSTEPIIHFYSGKWTPEVKGKNGVNYGPFSGLCLETHKHPNAMNIPSFPGIMLRPGEVYKHKTTYEIGYESAAFEK
jgi:aldose 1-epimerase